MQMFWNQIDILAAHHCKCTKCQGVAYLKIVYFVLYEFHFNLKKGGGKSWIGHQLIF